MAINFTCTSCDQPLLADEQFAGQIIECPGCGLRQPIPDQRAPETSVANATAAAEARARSTITPPGPEATAAGTPGSSGRPAPPLPRRGSARPGSTLDNSMTPTRHMHVPSSPPAPVWSPPLPPNQRMNSPRPPGYAGRGVRSSRPQPQQPVAGAAQQASPPWPQAPATYGRSTPFPAGQPTPPQPYGPGAPYPPGNPYGGYPYPPGYGYGYGYGYPPYGYPYRPHASPKHPQAKSILTMAILGIALGLMCGVPIILGDIAFFMSLSARRDIAAGRYARSGGVTAGFVIGIICLILTALFAAALLLS